MDILWINDVFEGDNAYYLCQNMVFDIEKAVIALIEETLLSLELTKDQCTLLGYSKGGSAALYYGLTYDFKNIIASGPQMHIGSFTKAEFPRCYEHMTLDGSPAEIEQLDSVLPNALLSVDDYEKNIYILSSESDQFHDSEIEPYLESWRRFSNFNLIMTDSDLVREHKTLGAYNTPTILSLVYGLGEGLAPRFLSTVNGTRSLGTPAAAEQYQNELKSKLQWVVTAHELRVSGSKLFITGDALVLGSPQRGYTDKDISLNLSSGSTSVSYPLGSLLDDGKSNKYFQRYFCDYTGAGYGTPHGQGLDLESLSCGVYKLELHVKTGGLATTTPVKISSNHSVGHFSGPFYYHISARDGIAHLTKRPAVGEVHDSGKFEVRFVRVDASLIFLEGSLLVPGLEMGEYREGTFNLTLFSGSGTYTFEMGQGNRESLNQGIDSAFGDYSKAYFATKKYAGIDLAVVPPGAYALFVTLAVRNSIFSFELGHRVEIAEIGEGPGSVRKILLLATG